MGAAAPPTGRFGTVRSGIEPARSHCANHAGLDRAVGAWRSISWKVIFSGIRGEPQSRPKENDQSSVTITPTAPACFARVMRASISSRPPTQYIWKNVFGLAAMTSSIGLEAKEDRPIAVPRAAAARATATSPSGWTACTPVGEISTGSEMSWPITVVAISLVAGRPATCGANPSSENAATLSRIVTPASAPATSAPYTSFGRCLLARRCATATVSNHLFAMTSSSPSCQRRR